MNVVKSKNGVPIRLTEERWIHITEEHSEMAGYYFEVLETVEEPEAIYEGKMGECIRKQMFYTLQIRSERYMKSGAKGYESMKGILDTTKISIGGKSMLSMILAIIVVCSYS